MQFTGWQLLSGKTAQDISSQEGIANEIVEVSNTCTVFIKVFGQNENHMSSFTNNFLVDNS